MVPDGIPGITQEISQGMIIGLAGQNTGIRFDAHIIQGGRTSLDTQITFYGVEVAVHGRGVPDQPLTAVLRMRFRNFEQRWQIIFRN